MEGRTTVDYHLSTNLMDVTFSEVESRDGERNLLDFKFDGLQPQADGTFAGGGLRGAFLGPYHEEVVGAFHHNTASVTGSFGAQRMLDTVTLEEAGSVEATGSITSDSETHLLYEYYDWGFWGEQFGENLFGVILEENTRQVGNLIYYDPPNASISGAPSGSNPVSGNAVWLGGVRAFDTSRRGYPPVSGNAKIEVDFSASTLDVDFTDFDTGRDDLSWEGLQVAAGSFQDAQFSPTIEGAFYGSGHQGAAGKFDRDNLQGVFGAVRN